MSRNKNSKNAMILLHVHLYQKSVEKVTTTSTKDIINEEVQGKQIRLQLQEVNKNNKTTFILASMKG
jgi:hypothetical protein